MVHFVGDSELDIGVAALVGLDHLLSFLGGQLFGGDHLDVLLLVQDLAVLDVSLDDLGQVRKSAGLDDGVDEVVGDLAVVVLGEGVEHFLLLCSLDG